MLKKGCYYKLVFDEMDWVMHPELCKELRTAFGGSFRKLLDITVASTYQRAELMFEPREGLINYFGEGWMGRNCLKEIHPKEILKGILND